MKKGLSEKGFRVVMEKLQESEKFRRQLLSGEDAIEIIGRGLLSAEDERYLATIVWGHTKLQIDPIDEKLVLCSSSGY